MHQDRRRQMLRLSAAAALQTFAGLRAVEAWDTSGLLPEAVQIELRDVVEIYERWQRERAARDPVPYPEFAEPHAATPPQPGWISRHG